MNDRWTCGPTVREGAAWKTNISRNGTLVRTVYAYGGSRREAEQDAGREMREAAKGGAA